MVQRQFEKLASGFKVYGLNRNTVKQISIAYPRELNEQKRIAKILAKWDEAIELQEKLIAKLEEQKKALMQKLLIPKEGWKETTLEKVVTKEKGKIVTFDENGKYPVIDMNYSLTGQIINYTNDYGTYASKRDVLLLWDGSGAGTPICNVSGVVGSTFAKLTCRSTLSNIYLYYYLFAMYEKNKLLREGSGVPHVPKDYLKMQKIYLPNYEEQINISNFLSKFDENIFLHKQELQKLKQQQKALQQLLLTGIVRV